MRSNLRDTKWEEKITEAMNLQESWESFTNLINHKVKKNILVHKAFNTKDDTQWITNASPRAIKKKTHKMEEISIVEQKEIKSYIKWPKEK